MGGVSRKRTVTVVASANSTLLVIGRKTFLELVAQQPEVPAIIEDAQTMQNLMADTDALCRLECFNKLDRDFVEALCQHLEPRLVYPNVVLMRENNYGNEMYILQRGLVKVEKGGNKIVELSGGVVLGELAVLGADKRRTATVTCIRLSLVYVLHGDVFHEILEKFPHAKKVFDHAYINRLVTFELAKNKDEMGHLNTFYGRAHPMPVATMLEQVYGVKKDKSELEKTLGEKGKKTPRGCQRKILLPKIQSARGVPDANQNTRAYQ